jgi:hypothetical protein
MGRQNTSTPSDLTIHWTRPTRTYPIRTDARSLRGSPSTAAATSALGGGRRREAARAGRGSGVQAVSGRWTQTRLSSRAGQTKGRVGSGVCLRKPGERKAESELVASESPRPGCRHDRIPSRSDHPAAAAPGSSSCGIPQAPSPAPAAGSALLLARACARQRARSIQTDRTRRSRAKRFRDARKWAKSGSAARR